MFSSIAYKGKIMSELSLPTTRSLQETWRAASPEVRIFFKILASFILSSALIVGGYMLDSTYGWTALPSMGVGAGVVYSVMTMVLTAIFTALTFMPRASDKTDKGEHSTGAPEMRVDEALEIPVDESTETEAAVTLVATCRPYTRVKTSEEGLQKNYFHALTQQELDALLLQLKVTNCFSYTLPEKPDTLYITCSYQGILYDGSTIYSEPKILTIHVPSQSTFCIDRLPMHFAKIYIDKRIAGTYPLSKQWDQLIPMPNAL